MFFIITLFPVENGDALQDFGDCFGVNKTYKDKREYHQVSKSDHLRKDPHVGASQHVPARGPHNSPCTLNPYTLNPKPLSPREPRL